MRESMLTELLRFIRKSLIIKDVAVQYSYNCYYVKSIEVSKRLLWDHPPRPRTGANAGETSHPICGIEKVQKKGGFIVKRFRQARGP